jgi:hypothetical protein
MKRKTGQDRSITNNWRPATQAVRGGTARSEYGETSEALFLTSGYSYDKAADAAARFAGRVDLQPHHRTAPTNPPTLRRAPPTTCAPSAGFSTAGFPHRRRSSSCRSRSPWPYAAGDSCGGGGGWRVRAGDSP